MNRTITSISNKGHAELVVQGMTASMAGLVLKVQEQIPAGGQSEISLELDTAALNGPVQASVVIQTNDPVSPEITIDVKGNVESQIEMTPRPAIFVTAFRWQVDEKEGSIVLTNKGKTPIKSINVKTSETNFTPKLTPVEEGQRYQISVKLNSNAPADKTVGLLTIYADEERIEIPVYTFLKEKVYLNPPSVEFGLIDLKGLEANPAAVDYMKHSVFLYQHQGKDFQIQIEAPDFLLVERTPPQGAGAIIDIPRQGQTSVFELIVSPIKEKVKKGPIETSIRVTTNDPDFPVVTIPVRGEVN